MFPNYLLFMGLETFCLRSVIPDVHVEEVFKRFDLIGQGVLCAHAHALKCCNPIGSSLPGQSLVRVH